MAHEALLSIKKAEESAAETIKKAGERAREIGREAAAQAEKIKRERLEEANAQKKRILAQAKEAAEAACLKEQAEYDKELRLLRDAGIGRQEAAASFLVGRIVGSNGNS